MINLFSIIWNWFNFKKVKNNFYEKLYCGCRDIRTNVETDVIFVLLDINIRNLFYFIFYILILILIFFLVLILDPLNALTTI